MKIVKLFVAMLLVVGILTTLGCDGEGNSNTLSNITSSTTQSTASKDTQTVDPATCNHTYTEIITRKPRVLDVGEKTFTCYICKSSYTEEIPRLDTDSFKVLAIGNSLTNDSTQYLWQILNNAGIENVVVGRLFESGCSINEHWTYITEFAEVYDYSESFGSGWVPYGKYSVQMALEKEDWDYIILQETIASATYPNSYKNLENLVNFVKTTNPDAELAWQLMWAYQAETESQWCRYHTKQEQALMYDQIVSVYKTYVRHNKSIEHLIPSGTAVQNLRTSYIGDTITIDGLHMTHSHGRYLTALTWYAALTGGDVDIIDWYPLDYPVVANDIDVIRRSVKDAIKQPFAVTQQAK